MFCVQALANVRELGMVDEQGHSDGWGGGRGQNLTPIKVAQ